MLLFVEYFQINSKSKFKNHESTRIKTKRTRGIIKTS